MSTTNKLSAYITKYIDQAIDRDLNYSHDTITSSLHYLRDGLTSAINNNLHVDNILEKVEILLGIIDREEHLKFISIDQRYLEGLIRGYYLATS